jgi:hypothetical protein
LRVFDGALLRRQLVGAVAETAVVDGQHREPERPQMVDAVNVRADVAAGPVQVQQDGGVRRFVRCPERMQADRLVADDRVVLDPRVLHVVRLCELGQFGRAAGRCRNGAKDPLALLQLQGGAAAQDGGRGQRGSEKPAGEPAPQAGGKRDVGHRSGLERGSSTAGSPAC